VDPALDSGLEPGLEPVDQLEYDPGLETDPATGPECQLDPALVLDCQAALEPG